MKLPIRKKALIQTERLTLKPYEVKDVNDCDIEGTEIEIGYVVHPGYQGHGYATEAVNAVIEDLREMGFQKVVAGFFEENKPSCRVMEKCGMRPNGVVDEEEYRGIRHKCLYYELVL